MKIFKGKRERSMFFIGLIIFFIILFLIAMLRKISYDIYVIVTPAKETVELKFQGESVNFGVLSPGIVAKKFIELKNDSNFRSIVFVNLDGKIKKWIKTKRIFLIPPNKKGKIELIIKIPEVVNFGSYKGRIKIYSLLTAF